MSQWIQRMVLTAVVGVFAGGAVMADQPAPAATGGAGGAGGGAAPAPTGAAPTFVAAPGAPAFVQGGCGSVASDCCCDKGRHGRNCGKHHGKRAGLAIGAGCANDVGCSSCASTRTFVFGSCHQFFNAGDRCGHHGWFGGRAHCATPPLGTGGLGNYGPCAYGSYLNR